MTEKLIKESSVEDDKFFQPEPFRNFCAAPWIEGVLRANGDLQTCCRNLSVLGNWQETGLLSAWHSPAFQQFRKKVVDGIFPDEQCKKCFYNGTATTLLRELIGPFYRNRQILYDFTQTSLPVIDEMESLFNLSEMTAEASEILHTGNQVLHQFQINYDRLVDCPEAVKQALQKLLVIGSIVESYLSHNLKPSMVVPYRQVELQAKCNARCVHCMNLYSHEIIDGPELDPRYIDEAFSSVDHIIDFFMNGSELLFYNQWQSIAQTLVSHSVQLGISTNGIALIPKNVKFLVDQKIIHTLNISLDGATKEMIERIHVNVKYDKLMENINYLLRYSKEKSFSFVLVFSFVIMKSNYHEFPQMIRLLHQIKQNYENVHIVASGHPLVRFSSLGYQAFLEKEHMTQIPRENLKSMFYDVQRASHETGIQTAVFSYQTIDQFIEDGCPVATLDNNTILLTEKSQVL